ncbi:hypothetical protein VTJ04DRAFT_7530 [Mycothermus thermophilus]|uniref:uncharacterized protein n=1 Tax=Humicola insolens TaxID=85995 RepID=UPI0037444567
MHNSPRAGDRRRHPLCGFTPRRHFKLMRPGMASEAIAAAVGTGALKPLANTTYEGTTDGIREGVVRAWRKGTDYVLNSEQCCTRWGISDITTAMVLLFWLRICEVGDHVRGQGKLRLFYSRLTNSEFAKGIRLIVLRRWFVSTSGAAPSAQRTDEVAILLTIG